MPVLRVGRERSAAQRRALPKLIGFAIDELSRGSEATDRFCELVRLIRAQRELLPITQADRNRVPARDIIEPAEPAEMDTPSFPPSGPHRLAIFNRGQRTRFRTNPGPKTERTARSSTVIVRLENNHATSASETAGTAARRIAGERTAATQVTMAHASTGQKMAFANCVCR